MQKCLMRLLCVVLPNLLKNLRAALLSNGEKCPNGNSAALKNSFDLTTGNVWLCDTEIQNMPYKAKYLQQTKHWKIKLISLSLPCENSKL